MSFASPWLLLLASIPAAAILLQFLSGRGGGGGKALPAVLRAFTAGGRVRLGEAIPRRPWRFWLGFLLLVVALARPQWGAKPDESDRRDEVVIALDLSRSMLATDAVPSRIERARTIATRFVAQSPADIGLIAFAGQAYLLAAPSADRALLQTFLPAVQPEQMVVPGSNLASMLNVALQAFDKKAASRTLVLLSDGEAEPTPWRQALPQLRARGIHIVAVGLGTPSGGPIRIGGSDLVDASGAAVTSRLQADVMRDLARTTGGAYLDASASGDLAARVRAIGEQSAAKRAGPARGAKEDRFGWFLLPALLLLLWSVLAEWPALPRLLRARRRWTRPAAYASAAGLALLLAGPRSQAVKPQPTLPRAAEPDPLLPVKEVVRDALVEREPTGADYMALAQASIRYVEVHRQHLHPLQRGVMLDGLAAVDAGQAIDPARPGWASVRAKLVDLLKPPRRADDAEEGDGEISGQPKDATGPKPDDVGTGPKAPPQDSRTVGGAPRSKAEEAEWRVPSLVKPLYTLQKLRRADRPGELFRLMQLQQPAPGHRSDQTW